MFGLFKKERKRGEQFLVGSTDIHCHILPGVDDGFASLSTSVELLEREANAGVKRVYFTPHSMGLSGAVVDPRSYGTHHHHHPHSSKGGKSESSRSIQDESANASVFSSERNYEFEIEKLRAENKIVPSSILQAAREKEYAEINKLPEFLGEPIGGFSDAHLKAKFEKFKKFYTGRVDVRLAAEYMMNKEFLDKVKAKDLLTYSDGVHVLVETSYYSAPLEMDEILYTLQIEGYKPILAHPERYRYMGWNDYEKLKEKGIEFQLTYLSLTGYYGKTTLKCALDLLDRGFFDYTGSDYHRTSTFIHYAHKLDFNRRRTEALEKLFANNSKL